jgi:hypothetical protein
MYAVLYSETSMDFYQTGLFRNPQYHTLQNFYYFYQNKLEGFEILVGDGPWGLLSP